MQCIVASEPVRVAISVKRLVRQMMEVASDVKRPLADRIEAGKLAMQGVDRLLDLIAHPKRPAATGARGAARIDLATILDAHPVGPEPGPCTAQDVTDQPKLVESRPSADGDALLAKQ